MDAENTNIQQIDLYAALIKQIEKHTDLIFIGDNSDQGNICMANSEEVRTDYRSTFTSAHLSSYIFAIKYSPRYREQYKTLLKPDHLWMLYPSSTEEFWKIVEDGEKNQKSAGLTNQDD